MRNFARRLGVYPLMKVSLLAAVLPVIAWSQNTPSAFEVASIKPNGSLSERALLQAVPGRLLMENFAPRALIVLAWGLERYQVTGGPSWMESARYNIEAKAEGNPTVQQMEGPMLQALIQNRFQLTFHRETKQLAGFDLSLAGRQAKLQHSREGSCVPYSVDAPPPLAPAPGQVPALYCGFPRYGAAGPERSLEGKEISISALTKALTRSELHRPVNDRTGLTGLFDLHLKWTSDSAAGPDSPDAVSIFTALKEQLGLKLEAAPTSTEVLVIDRIEKPSAN